MPPKGDQTRQRILRKAARLFNERGYSGASMNDILRATGLQKGGLYNHFASKEDLAVEAFEYSVRRVSERVQSWLVGKNTAPERLHALIGGFLEYAQDPPVPGGCPLMNTAIENDDSNARLRERARLAMEQFLGGIAAIVKGGIKRGELRADADPAQAAMVLLATFEGALMLSRLNRDGKPMQQAAEFMRRYVDELQE
ncbi:MAG: TetR/AcrR family transcriptional regulator [Acidobacteria bacterium]|nr:TetR/AcrR family transcriptional regulator [Acidobacteriota bacterium]